MHAVYYCMDCVNRESFYSTLSFLYALLIMVLGVAFPIAEMFGIDADLHIGSFEVIGHLTVYLVLTLRERLKAYTQAYLSLTATLN
jgi:hypothetical protein